MTDFERDIDEMASYLDNAIEDFKKLKKDWENERRECIMFNEFKKEEFLNEKISELSYVITKNEKYLTIIDGIYKKYIE